MPAKTVFWVIVETFGNFAWNLDLEFPCPLFLSHFVCGFIIRHVPMGYYPKLQATGAWNIVASISHKWSAKVANDVTESLPSGTYIQKQQLVGPGSEPPHCSAGVLKMAIFQYVTSLPHVK